MSVDVWLVTGASGFVGGHIVRALGAEARPLLRSDVPHWNEARLRTFTSGVEGVIHCASIVHKPGTPARSYEQFNVEGTRALVEASRASGVKRFIFISSIKVCGETPLSPINEQTPLAGDQPYATTKAEAERIVLAAADLQPIVLRLCPVYGRGDKGNVQTMIRAIHRRRFFVPGDGQTRKSIVHVATVVDVVRAAMRRPATGVFVVADRHAPTIRELANVIARAVGRRPPASIPRGALLVAAGAVARIAHALRVSSSVSEQLIVKATTSSVCDPTRVRSTLAVDCSADLEATIRDEVAWLRETGRL